MSTTPREKRDGSPWIEVMGQMRVIHVHCNLCHHLVPSKGASLEQHGQQMGTLAGTRLNMSLRPQQTAETNPPH